MKKIVIIFLLSIFMTSCWIWNKEDTAKTNEENENEVIVLEEKTTWQQDYKKDIVFQYAIRDLDWNLIYETKESYKYDFNQTKFPLNVKSKIADLSIWEVVETTVKSEELFNSTKEEKEIKTNKYDKEHSVLIDKKAYSSTKEVTEEWQIIEDATIWEWKFVVMSIDKNSDYIRLAKRHKENPFVWEDIEKLKVWDQVYMNEFWTHFVIKEIDIENKKIKWETYFNPYEWQKLRIELKRII